MTDSTTADAASFTARQAWLRSDVTAAQPWRKAMPSQSLNLACERIEAWKHAGCDTPVVDVKLGDDARTAGREALRDVRDELDQGCGFVVIDRLPVEGWSTDEASLAYQLIGSMVGKPVAQAKSGARLYDVIDTGADVKQGARFSVTNAPSSFHTDGAFNPRIADYVGLLCIRTAKSGGESQMASACSVHNAIGERSAELLAALYAPFWFDRRGQHEEGESPACANPVFAYDGRELTMRYLRYYIDEGHRVADEPLSNTQRAALDAVDQCLNDPQFHVDFRLEPGQMLLSNNHWLLHSRSGYEDHADPALRRHYVRLWLNRSA